MLNIGHTFGHAIETLSKHKILDGEAVAIGLVMAMKLSIYKKFADKKDLYKLVFHLKSIGLPTTAYHIEKLIPFMKKVKIQIIVLGLFYQKE